MKKAIIVLVVLLAAMFFTNPKEDKHVEKYKETTSLVNQGIGLISTAEYSNFFVLSYYKKGDYSSVGTFGLVIGL